MPWISLMKHATLPSTTLPSISKRYVGTTADAYGVGRSTSEIWCFTSSKATRAATSSPRPGRDRTSSWKCSNQEPTSCKPLTVKSSPMLGTSNSNVSFTLNLSKLNKECWCENRSLFHLSLVTPDPNHDRRLGITRGLLTTYPLGKTFHARLPPYVEVG